MPKAFIENIDTGERIDVLFNPKEYTVSKSNNWQPAKTSGSNVPDIRFASGQPAKLTVQLFFDTYEDKSDVRKHTDKIAALMDVKFKDEGERKKLRPPKVKFHWGETWSFNSVVVSMTQKFTLFLSTGTPVRATVDLTLQQIEDEGVFPNQNPTSGGSGGRRTRVVGAGETLDWIAYQEFGDASAWRRVAEANRIVDPLDLKPGTVLIIEPEA